MSSHNPSDSEQSSSKERLTRRDLIRRLGNGAWWTTLGLVLVGMVRSYSPWVTSEPSAKFKIGRPADYPEGSNRNFHQENVMVFRDNEGMFAISMICTHLGCVVSQAEKGFKCACHGSVFSSLGELVQGPAPKGLDWLEVSMAPNGQLVVDRSKPVRFGGKFNLKTT